jgi:putative FmdB family regulatory protein
MPIYEYECDDCDHITEVIQQKVGPDREYRCAICGNKARLAVSVPSMQPDDMWNGHYSVSLGRHFNSRSEYNSYCKEKGFEVSGARDRGAIESAARAKVAKAQKEKNDRLKTVSTVVRDYMA